MKNWKKIIKWGSLLFIVFYTLSCVFMWRLLEDTNWKSQPMILGRPSGDVVAATSVHTMGQTFITGKSADQIIEETYNKPIKHFEKSLWTVLWVGFCFEVRFILGWLGLCLFFLPLILTGAIE